MPAFFTDSCLWCRVYCAVQFLLETQCRDRALSNYTWGLVASTAGGSSTCMCVIFWTVFPHWMVGISRLLLHNIKVRISEALPQHALMNLYASSSAFLSFSLTTLLSFICFHFDSHLFLFFYLCTCGFVTHLECWASVRVLMPLLWLCTKFWRCVRRWPRTEMGLSPERTFYFHLQQHKTSAGKFRFHTKWFLLHTMPVFKAPSQHSAGCFDIENKLFSVLCLCKVF